MSDARWMQDCVREFHVATGNPAPKKLSLDDVRLELRAKLILEEAFETIEAMGFEVEVIRSQIGQHIRVTRIGDPDWVEVIDGLCDLTYVTIGTAVEMGLELLPFFHAVHHSNMKKIGGPVREDGKSLKPPGWKPPPIRFLLDRLISKEGIGNG